MSLFKITGIVNKYLLYLPKEEELKEIINQDRIRFELDQNNNKQP